MNLKINIGVVLLSLLCGCSSLVLEEETIANATAEIQQGQTLPITATAKIGGQIIKLEVAQTAEQQAMGLMFRESLADDRGMLFPFKTPRVASFWMKNVPIALDMIFLKGDRIINIANATPCDTESCTIYGSDGLVDKVIELRGGRAKELGIKPGDKISLEKVNN